VEKTAQRASSDLQRPGRDARRAADVRGAFKYRRCIIPASSFYEWTGAKGAKFAVKRDHWSGSMAADGLPNATIIVGEANNWMRRFHDRMPIILD
jgi:putative SOS response-associated peptidase YedK